MDFILPLLIKVFAIFAAWLIGIANPNPSTLEPADFATTIPIRLPEPLNNAPPEFPGLMEASVCSRFSFLLPIVNLRFKALMIPVDAVLLSSPKGFPIATTWSPTASLELLP